MLLNFKGGKGVATALGVLLATDWISALICLGMFLVVVFLTRMVSLGSILAALCFPFIWIWRMMSPIDSPIVIDTLFMTLFVIFLGPMVLPLVLMAILLIVKHRANIGRIIRGEENKLSFKRKTNE